MPTRRTLMQIVSVMSAITVKSLQTRIKPTRTRMALVTLATTVVTPPTLTSPIRMVIK
jgi:hypothetical protein